MIKITPLPVYQKRLLIFGLALATLGMMMTGCKPKAEPKTALEHKLIETMGNFLHKTLRPETTFQIREVSFYEDTTQHLFICQFKVDMHYIHTDTTGTMVATISKDFSKVARSQ